MKRTKAAWQSARSVLSGADSVATASTCSSNGSFYADITYVPHQEKSVRFSKHSYERKIPSSKFMSEQEKQDVWHTSEESQEIKIAARQAVSNTVHTCQALIADISESYRNTRLLSTTMDEYDTEELLNDSSSLAIHGDAVIEWCHDEVETRGLEQWISDVHRYGRKDCVDKARSVVVQMSMFQGQDEELVARVYSQLSRSSVLLARIFAEGDYQAASKSN